MLGNKKLFSTIDNSIQSQITLGDDHHVKEIGKGVIYILAIKNKNKYICDFFYVKNIKNHFLSFWELSKHLDSNTPLA